ncbi:hypothetical protein [Shewanella sp. NIFS-20-20]|uniref:hypothetical protein n=1 Tax=Shewanella sp. NIFS-20-20 TaxID=2853806 RepID=UPI001C442378|nr:hypothetical protein [Shewanella sp. NIFS-20-20]MBV7316167.1 hypothetical protein [Shewanella sp. NIFS-20-20]
MRWISSFSLLVLALVLYCFGQYWSAISLIVLGVVFELAFWWSLFLPKSQHNND